jgi:predicted small secreted protein
MLLTIAILCEYVDTMSNALYSVYLIQHRRHQRMRPLKVVRSAFSQTWAIHSAADEKMRTFCETA